MRVHTEQVVAIQKLGSKRALGTKSPLQKIERGRRVLGSGATQRRNRVCLALRLTVSGWLVLLGCNAECFDRHPGGVRRSRDLWNHHAERRRMQNVIRNADGDDEAKFGKVSET